MTHDAHEHDHPPHLGHHWETPKQQFEAGKLGMWLFLATEVLLFGGLFCGYAWARYNHPGLFAYGSEFLDTKWGAINTCVLILSSLTMAWAVTLAQQGRQAAMMICLVLTLGGAAGFMGIKYIEYTSKFDHGIYPGPTIWNNDYVVKHAPEEGIAMVTDDGMPEVLLEVPTEPVESIDEVDPVEQLPPAEASTAIRPAVGPSGISTSILQASHAEVVHDDHGEDEHDSHKAHATHPAFVEDRPRNPQLFFNIYFMMTGLHGIHVIIGAIVICWLIFRGARGEFGKDYFTPVDLGGLYWHVVDLIWIFLFPLFYLI